MKVIIIFTSLITSLQCCSKDFFPSVWDYAGTIEEANEDLNHYRDEASGCKCGESPGLYWVCSGKGAICRSFPKTLNFTTTTFYFKSSQVVTIKPGDLLKVTHVETLMIECNYNLSVIETGSFRGLHMLKNLSISYNTKLDTLQRGSFDGLDNLEKVRLSGNGFVTLFSVTAALTNLPKLAKLDLSENKFKSVGDDDFEVLRGGGLIELNLMLCGVEEIGTGAFNPLGNLTHLSLGQNKFDPGALGSVIMEATKHTPIDVLNLASMGAKKTTLRTLFTSIGTTNISKLCLGENQLKTIESEVFQDMPNIRVLDLSSITLTNISNDAFRGLTNLEVLLMDTNKLLTLPEGLLLHQLRYLDLRHSLTNEDRSDFFGEKFFNMSNLHKLDLSLNRLHGLHERNFHGLSNLQRLDLQSSNIIRIENGTFAPLSHLEYLNLEKNAFVKNDTWREHGLFAGLNNLKVLLLGECGIRVLSSVAFKDFPKLEHLGLERNKLMVLPSFAPLGNLKSVNLSENSLRPWQESVFSHNHELQEVRIDGNKIVYLSPKMVRDLDGLKVLNLSNNPFTCDCSFAWKSKKIFVLVENQTLPCTFPESTTKLTVQEFFHDDYRCFNYALVISLVVLVLLVILTAFGVYWYRWHLKYWLFLTRLHLRRTLKVYSNKRATSCTSYIYDAFISYSSEDRDFVLGLVQMLENHPPFIQLCIYERDFEIGSMISDNILDSVSRSRKTVLVISDSYAKSKWCRWESQIAEFNRLFRKNEGGKYVDDNVIFIKLGVVNDAHMTPMLKYLLKTRIYLQWEDDDEKKKAVFWQKLRKVLAPPVPMYESHI